MKASYDVVLHIPSLKAGGAERVAIEIGRYLADNGYATAFFIHHADISFELPPNVDLILSKRRGHAQRVAEFHAFLHEVPVHAVLSFLPYANLISLFAMIGLKQRPRLVASEHRSYAGIAEMDVKERIKFALLGWAYHRSDAIVAVSKGIANELEARLGEAASSKITVIYNPCFVPGEAGPFAVREPSGCRLLAVGRLVPDKGFDVLIDALARVRRTGVNAVLTIAGEGPERRNLQAEIDHLGLSESVSMPGFSRDMAPYYRQTNLFVCASRTEGFGNVIVEAMSFGLPVVSTACPYGPAEILEDGRFGTLVPVGDAASLADAIVKSLCATHDPQRQVQRARDFSLDKIGTRYAVLLGIAA